MFQAPIPDLPPGIDDAFQVALADQQIARLAGGETLFLEGLLRGRPRFAAQLPELRAAALCRFAGQAATRLDLVPDTLLVDGDSERASIVYRGSLALPDERSLEGAQFAAGVERPDVPFVFPDSPTAPLAVPPRGEHGTLVMEDGSQNDPAPATLVLEGAPPAGASLITTVVMEGAVDARSLPFPRVGGPRPARLDTAPPAAIPGAPWDTGEDEVTADDPPNARRGPFVPANPLFDQTLDLTVPPAAPAAPSIAAAAGIVDPITEEPTAPRAPPAPPPPQVVPTRVAWRKADEPPPSRPFAAPAAPPTIATARQAAPAVKKSIYGRFGK
ncbi:MAG: DUF2169 domain-containing protein [Polyangiaceae bacterium]